MKKSTKAALLSAFVLPGAGHFFLKKYPMSLALAAAAFAGLYSIIATSLEAAQTIADRIVSGQIPADINAITDFASSQAMMADTHSMNMATGLLFLAWVVGIIDAYRLGRKEDLKEQK